MAQREHEERIGEELIEFAGDQQVARRGVAEGALTHFAGSSSHELDGVALHLMGITGLRRFPARRRQHQAADLAAQLASELEGKGAVGEVERAVLAGVADRRRRA
ncbi:MAG TPA: hypothetical protein VNG93_06540 [Candidatus Dormibacteraeota bacterium]|nr:hypothetical protein [Candidatus Dormibacteraeota bacterium]